MTILNKVASIARWVAEKKDIVLVRPHIRKWPKRDK